MEPWMFSVQLTSHVTVLSCRTSFQRWPAGGTGIQDSLSIREVNNEQKLVSVDSGRLCMVPSAKLLKLFHCYRHTLKILQRYPLPPLSHLLQFMMMSSGWILFFSMPCFGCSPLPRNRPGGSILKLPMRSLWWSSRQYPNSSRIFWLASFNACDKWMINLKLSRITFLTFMNWMIQTSFSSLLMFFLASTFALCMAWISPKSHLSSSRISDLSSSVISLSDTKH